MATKVSERPNYDNDYYLWALDQAARLREIGLSRRNEPVDWELLAEEIEELARSDRRACASWLELIISHLLKLAFASSLLPRSHWRGEIANFRSDLRKTMTTAIGNQLRQNLDEHYSDGRYRAIEALVENEPNIADRLPTSCPWTLQEIIGDWLPPPRG